MKTLSFSVNGQKIQKLLYQGKGVVYFEGDVNIEYDGELCTEENHGLIIFHPNPIKSSLAEKFAKLVWDKKKKKYSLQIQPLSKYNNTYDTVTPISLEEYQNNDDYGPKSKIYFKITKGEYKDYIAACDFEIEIPPSLKKSGGKRVKDGVKDSIEQKEFCFFEHHPSSEFLYGYLVKQKELGGKNVYIFNLKNKKIQSVAYKKSATKPAQATHLKNMVSKVQQKLSDCIEEYNANISNIKFSDDEAERRCGNGLDFYLHNCFKYLIEDHIDKFFNAGI